MSTGTELIILCVTPFIICFVLVIWLLKKQQQTLRDFSKFVDGTLHDSSKRNEIKIDYTREGVDINYDLHIVGKGESALISCRFATKLSPAFSDKTLNVSKNLRSFSKQKLGISLGHPLFDKKFVVYANDSAWCTRILSGQIMDDHLEHLDAKVTLENGVLRLEHHPMFKHKILLKSTNLLIAYALAIESDQLASQDHTEMAHQSQESHAW